MRTVPTIHFGQHEPTQAVDRLPNAKPNSYLLTRPITQVNLDVRLPTGIIPEDSAAELFDAAKDHAVAGASRSWPAIGYTWESPGLFHNPLYFEDVNLERHGLSFGIIQPAVSAAHFFSHVVALPYLMTDQHPRECVYALGYYRPGSCVPYYIHMVPFNGRAALVQAGVVTGAALVIP